MAIPTQPASYAWEATNEAIAERYHVAVEDIARFDTNTARSPSALVDRILAERRFGQSVSEYPPGDYGQLVLAAAARYGVGSDEILVGAGADEILDIIGKAFLPPGGTGVVPTPTYAMFGVVTEQRPATVVRVPRLGWAERFGLDAGAMRDAARSADVVWLCSPNNPTGQPEASGAIEALLETLAADAARAERAAPVVVLDEAYAEFTGASLLDLRDAYPRLVVIRTMSKAYAIAGLRVGFAIARPELIEAMAPYRPPGSVSVISVAVATRLLEDDGVLGESIAGNLSERARLADGLRGAGWNVLPSATNFLLVDFASPERAGAVADALLGRAIVPRTFGAEHPLAHCLRFTVRDRDQDDRLIAVAGELGP